MCSKTEELCENLTNSNMLEHCCSTIIDKHHCVKDHVAKAHPTTKEQTSDFWLFMGGSAFGALLTRLLRTLFSSAP